MSEQVIPKPLEPIPFWRKVLACLPGFCSYCGCWYVPCHKLDITPWAPLPPTGRACPNGHEGYVDRFYGYGWIRYHFDYIRNPPPIPVRSREELLLEDD